MRVGIVILGDKPWKVAASRWRRAEAYGFAHAWTYDHIGWRDLVDGPWFDAVPTLAAAATVTGTLRLGTLVASPNFRHPVPFARQLTALDDLSGGRLVLGVGSGGTGYDADVLGWPALKPRQRADRFTEFVTLLDEVLTHDRTTWRGTYYSAVDARSAPGCVQQPRIPFVVAANGPTALRLASRYGQGWVTTGIKDEDDDAWWRSVGELTRRFIDLGGQGRDWYLSLDSSPVYSLSSLSRFTESVQRAAELGFTDVISHWPRESSWFAGDEAILDEVAALLPQL
jgi:alkanesulfonate monooxygenase SsuD/methylene tetrahydromethanopterin reductase-like flavin-dependent oxidoreductase (luciferase family)